MGTMSIQTTAHENEKICARVLQKYLLSDVDLVVGDSKKMPDIHNVEKTMGIEVVQMEKDIDLDTKHIFKADSDNGWNGDFQKIQNFCNDKFPGRYRLIENEGKLAAIMPIGCSHSIDWMLNHYKELIIKKLDKLNHGNYDGISGEISLCVSMVWRLKREYDAFLWAYAYFCCRHSYKRSFSKVYIITYKKLFILLPDNIQSISPIIRQNAICDFDITGRDYIEKIPINFSACLCDDGSQL